MLIGVKMRLETRTRLVLIPMDIKSEMMSIEINLNLIAIDINSDLISIGINLY